MADASEVMGNFNALKDCINQTGEFIPGMRLTSGVGTINSYTAQKGMYHRIGNTVFYSVYIALGSVSVTGTPGDAFITGLPFPVAGMAYTQFTAPANLDGWNFGEAQRGSPMVFSVANTSELRIRIIVPAGALHVGANAQSGAFVNATGFYLTTN